MEILESDESCVQDDLPDIEDILDSGTNKLTNLLKNLKRNRFEKYTSQDQFANVLKRRRDKKSKKH